MDTGDRDQAGSISAFLRAHCLPESYVSLVERWFEPLAADIARYRAEAGRPLLFGINGSQGSGKSTLASLLTGLLGARHGLGMGAGRRAARRGDPGRMLRPV